MKNISTFLVASLFLTGQVYAKDAVVSAKAVTHLTNAYPKNPTAANVMADLHPNIPTEVYDFFQKKIAATKLTTLPTVVAHAADSVEVDYQGHTLLVRFLPKHQLVVNGHTLDLFAAETLDAQFKMILGALPNYQKAALFNAFVNRAEADDNAERITGGATFGAGAVGTSGAGAAAAMATGEAATVALGATGVGLIVMAGAYLVWNDGACEEIGEQKFECLEQKSILERNLHGQPAYAAAARAHRARPACGDKEVGNFDHEKTFSALNELVAAQGERLRAIVTCRQTKREFEACVNDLSLDAYYLCVDMFGRTDKFLPAFAKSGAAASQKKAAPGSSAY